MMINSNKETVVATKIKTRVATVVAEVATNTKTSTIHKEDTVDSRMVWATMWITLIKHAVATVMAVWIRMVACSNSSNNHSSSNSSKVVATFRTMPSRMMTMIITRARRVDGTMDSNSIHSINLEDNINNSSSNSHLDSKVAPTQTPTVMLVDGPTTKPAAGEVPPAGNKAAKLVPLLSILSLAANDF